MASDVCTEGHVVCHVIQAQEIKMAAPMSSRQHYMTEGNSVVFNVLNHCMQFRSSHFKFQRFIIFIQMRIGLSNQLRDDYPSIVPPCLLHQCTSYININVMIRVEHRSRTTSFLIKILILIQLF